MRQNVDRVLASLTNECTDSGGKTTASSPGSCFISRSEAKNYVDAFDACSSMGADMGYHGRLAHILNQDIVDSFPTTNFAWIGLKAKNAPSGGFFLDQWQWMDTATTASTSSTVLWNPAGTSIQASLSCMTLRYKYWVNQPCDELRPYICEVYDRMESRDVM